MQKKAPRGRMWKIMGKCPIYTWNVGVFHSQKGRGKEDSGRCCAEKARRNTRSLTTGTFREVLEQVSGNVDMGCSAQIIRKRYIAIRDDIWEEFRKGCREKEKSSEWTPEKIREGCEKVAKDEIGRLGIVQKILGKSTDFLRRIIAPVGGGVTLSHICPHCNSFPLEEYIWWVSTGHGDGNKKNMKHCCWWCTQQDSGGAARHKRR